jgi:DNA helicase TIP49 (TBP-interacting protein)
MGECFKNVHVTIAAASHAQSGILRVRRGITQSVEEEYELVEGTICNIVIQERSHSYEKLESLVHDFGLFLNVGGLFRRMYCQKELSIIQTQS